MGPCNLTQNQASTTITTFQCFVCCKTDHSHLDGHCPVLKRNHLILTKTPNSGNRNRSGNANKDPSGPTKDGASDSSKGGTTGNPGPSSIRFNSNSKPPSSSGAGAPNPTAAGEPAGPGSDAGSGANRPVSRRQANAPSIGSESTQNSPPEEASDSSSDNEPGWNMSNEEGVASLEANRVRANMAETSYLQAALPKPATPTGDSFSQVEASYIGAQACQSSTLDGSGGQGRGPVGRHLNVTTLHILAIDQPASHIWTPVKGSARKSKTSVSSYICADSGASRDLFTNRSWFVEYTDVRDRHECVVVADNTRVPIEGVGTVRFNLGGHEVLL
jgi:hypothetical protein